MNIFCCLLKVLRRLFIFILELYCHLIFKFTRAKCRNYVTNNYNYLNLKIIKWRKSSVMKICACLLSESRDY